MGAFASTYIGTDGVILVDRPDQAAPVAKALFDKDAALGDQNLLKEVRTIRTALPKDEAEKKPEPKAKKKKTK